MQWLCYLRWEFNVMNWYIVLCHLTCHWYEINRTGYQLFKDFVSTRLAYPDPCTPWHSTHTWCSQPALTGSTMQTMMALGSPGPCLPFLHLFYWSSSSSHDITAQVAAILWERVMWWRAFLELLTPWLSHQLVSTAGQSVCSPHRSTCIYPRSLWPMIYNDKWMW